MTENNSQTSSFHESAASDSSAASASSSSESPRDPEQMDFFAIDTPEELRPHQQTPHAAAIELPPALDRTRPVRDPLVPRWFWPTVATVALAVGVALAAFFISMAASRVTVPDVTGRSLGLARTMLAQEGLEVAVIERRFSAAPADQVLEQDPGPGSVLSKGESVGVVVSAGTEETVMPDVIGDGITLARGILEGLGLVVVGEPVPSSEPSDTVLSSTPSPGTVVRSGDVVRLQVSAPESNGDSLRPFDMQGLSITIDPAPTKDVTPDITLEVSRRLRSLLEASGATVAILRSSDDTATAETDRRREARRSVPTVAIGLSARAKGAGGRTVVSPSSSATTTAAAARLANEIVAQLESAAPPATETTRTSDGVLQAARAPWVRVVLGSFSDPADKSAFGDPRWADRVARALYTGIGEVFAPKEQP